MFRRTALVVLAAAISAASITAQEARPIEEGQTLSGTLSAESEHDFTLELGADQFVYGAVDQLTVDVIVTILDADGAIGRFDSPSRGEERFTFETDEAGTYTVRVTPFEDGEGDYTITIRRAEDIEDDPEDRVDQLLAIVDDDETPGAVVAIVEDGELVFEKAYGMANLTWDIPFEADMRSNIGSVTKQFTAMGLLLLEQEGRLSLDDEVREHIPELPDFGTPVTLRNLLNHVGGYREVYNAFGMMGYDGEDGFDREKVIQLVQRQPALQAEPNTEFNYNNTGYILVSMTIERVSGMSFQDYMREKVFLPLGMTNTLMTSHQGQVIPHSAMGYKPAEEGGYRQVLGLGTHRGRTIWTHTGGDVAHRTYFAWYPELESGVWVSSNNGTFSLALGRPLAEAFWEDEFDPEEEDEEVVEAEMSEERKEAIVGLWRLAAGLEIEIELEDGELRASPDGQSTRVLVPTSDSTLAVTGVEASITFRFEDDGSTNEATLDQNGEQPMSRVTEEDPELTPEMLMEYTGRYWSDEMEVAFVLSVEDGELVARNIRLEDITLDPGDDDSFGGGGIGAFEFKRSQNGRITGFMINNGRTKDVWFEREWTPGG